MATKSREFTWGRPIIIIALISTVFTLGVLGLGSASARAERNKADGNAKILNEGIVRANLAGDTNPVLTGDDSEALSIYLQAQGYIE